MTQVVYGSVPKDSQTETSLDGEKSFVGILALINQAVGMGIFATSLKDAKAYLIPGQNGSDQNHFFKITIEDIDGASDEAAA